MNCYGFAIHHVMIKKRKDSIMCVETSGGGYRSVPVLEVYFREETFKEEILKKSEKKFSNHPIIRVTCSLSK